MIAIQLSGTNAAIIVGAIVAFIAYPYQDECARRLRYELGSDFVCELSDRVGSIWRSRLSAANQMTSECWQARSYASRATLKCDFALAMTDWVSILQILEISIAEFKSNWLEFVIVAPGAIDRYPADISDLIETTETVRGLVTANS
jgi:hypothetical protein